MSTQRTWRELAAKNRPSLSLLYQEGMEAYGDMWMYNEHSDAQQWDHVLRDKWNMLVHYNMEGI